MAIENAALSDRTWELFYVIYPRVPASAAFVLSQNPPCRNHEPAFWDLVGQVLPDWQARQNWLDKNEHMLE